MAALTRHRWSRWLVPLVAAVLLASAGPVVAAISAAGRDPLPDRSASQLLVDVQQADVEGVSGTLVETSRLGLPTLPGQGGGNAGPTSLLSGSHTLRLWYDGPHRVRLALLGRLSESDVVRNGSDLWSWSSADNAVSHVDLADAADAVDLAGHRPTELGLTPQALADRALAAITPTTRVSTDDSAVVAGRSAYELVLEPRDPRSLVSAVHIAVDSATRVPTRVQIFARGQDDPALEVGYTDFDPTAPDASVFDFTPPDGTKVTEQRVPGPGATGSGPDRSMSWPDAPQVVGTGWAAVAVIDLPKPSSDGGSQSSARTEKADDPGDLEALLETLPKVSGAWGSGHLLRSALFSAVVTDDGRIAVGAVPPDLVYDALAGR